MTYAEHSDHYHYVTIRDGGRTCLAAGPFTSRAEAESRIDAIAAYVSARRPIDVPSTAFLAYGTSRLTMTPGRVAPVGKFNHVLRRT